MAYRWSCAAQRVTLLSSCARRSDDTDARKAVLRRFGRSDRRAQADRPTLRSIRPKRAVSLALARTIASSSDRVREAQPTWPQQRAPVTLLMEGACGLISPRPSVGVTGRGPHTSLPGEDTTMT